MSRSAFLIGSPYWRFKDMTCYPYLDRPVGEFPGVEAQGGNMGLEPLISDTGDFLPIALCGRTLL